MPDSAEVKVEAQTKEETVRTLWGAEGFPQSHQAHTIEQACTIALEPLVEMNALRRGEEAFHDAITGQPLRADMVHAARREELEYFAAKMCGRKPHAAKHSRSKARRL